MTTRDRFWVFATVFFSVSIIAGVLAIITRYHPSPPLEIMPPPPVSQSGEIYIGGAVNSPGIYTRNGGDSLESLVQRAGGVTEGGSNDRLELLIPAVSPTSSVQKVNINLAPAWLLQALPGVGESRANAIIQYREQHGKFRAIDELLRVEGIGPGLLDKIKDFITVNG